MSTHSATTQTTPVATGGTSWLSRIDAATGDLWQWLVCGLANLRRSMLRRRLSDYPVITLDGEILERDPDVPWYYGLLPTYRRPLSLESIQVALQRIAADPDTKGVIFLAKRPGLSLAQAQSLAALFNRFRDWESHARMPGAGARRIVVHIEELSTPLYVAACSADVITATPLTEWDVTGLFAAPTFLKDSLARIGIQFDVVRVAPWKTAADVVTLSHMSDAAREQYNWLFDHLFAGIVDAISGGRRLTAETVRKLIDAAPLTPQQARDNGLIDHVLYEDELAATLGASESHPPRPYARVRRLLYRRPRRMAAQEIGVISLRGAIMTGSSRSFPVPLPLFGDETLGSYTVQQLVRQARRDKKLGAVILHVDSPGGSALASDLIWRELYLLAQEKPLIVHMGDVAASGGYYIAVPGKKIVAQRATITGSIGVIAAKVVTAGAYALAGAHREAVQRGEHAGLQSDLRSWEGELRSAVEESIDYTYREFKQRVAAGRGLAVELLEDIAGGRVWTGEQALANGLVDALGDFQAAVDLACGEAGLPTDGSVRVTPVSMPGSKLLATPVEAARTLLGLQRVRQFDDLADFLATGELYRLLERERIWMIADGIPRV